MDVSLLANNWSYGRFLIFFAYFGQNVVAVATPLRPLQSENCLLWVGWPEKTLVITNHILVISRINAFMCIYSNFSLKIGCQGNAPLSLVYRSVTDEFCDGTNPISKPNSAWMCRLQLKLWPFFDFLAHFGHNLVAMATSLRPLQSEISSLDWLTTKTPCCK